MVNEEEWAAIRSCAVLGAEGVRIVLFLTLTIFLVAGDGLEWNVVVRAVLEGQRDGPLIFFRRRSRARLP